MPDKNKLLKKVRGGPKNVRSAQLKQLMEAFGFIVYRKSKHFVHYSHPSVSIRPAVSEHRERGQENKVHRCYVDACLKAIDELMLIEGDTNEE